jgi:hypothetical protein
MESLVKNFRLLTFHLVKLQNVSRVTTVEI